MYVNMGKVNGLFHAEAVNRRFQQNPEAGEEKKSPFLRRDIAVISPMGKAMSAVERLMKQKDLIRECKDSLLGQMADLESGYCPADVMKKIEEYDKQLDSIDQEIAKELAKPADNTDKAGESMLDKGKQPSTEQEVSEKRIAELTKWSAKLDQSEVMDSAMDRMEGEKKVLEAELKSGDSEWKRQRIAEIEDRTTELAKEAYQVSAEGREHFQYQAVHGTWGTFSDQALKQENLHQTLLYDELWEKSDNGFTRPTIEGQLRGAYSGYLEQAIEKGMAEGEDIYDFIVDIHKDSLMKAYQEVYQDIVTGYENGTREVWTQDMEEGADYIEVEREGKTYRFHKLTMEEELARLDQAYEKTARRVEDAANLMIRTQEILDKVMPEYQEKMREIGEQLAARMGISRGEAEELTAEQIKEKLAVSEGKRERVPLFEMLMEARKSWLKGQSILDGKSYS